MHKKAVIFDLDGTLTVGKFPNKEVYMQYKLRLYNALVSFDKRLENILKPDDFLYRMRFLAREFFKNNALMKAKVTQIADEIIDEYGVYAQKFFKPDPHAKEVIKSLKDNSIKIGICTFSSRRIAYQTLRKIGIFDLIDVILCRDDVEYPKPDPRHLLDTVSRLQVTPKEALYVGDSAYDVECAKAAGIDVVIIVRDLNTNKKYDVPVIYDLRDILKIIGISAHSFS